MLRRVMGLLLAVLAAGPADATQLLREVVQHSTAAADGGEAPEIEVLLGFDVALRSPLESRDGRRFRARLEAIDGESLPWQFAELRFDESGYDVGRVAMEGSSARGFELVVEFPEPMQVVTVPQYASNRLALKYLPRRGQRRATRRAAAGLTGTGGAWAVDLGLDQPLLRLDQVPRSLLLGRVLYAVDADDASAPRNVRIGFFSRPRAESILAEAQGTFPAARLVQVDADEAAYGSRMRINPERVTKLFGAGAVAANAGDAGPAISISTTTEPVAPAPEPAGKLLEWQTEADDSLLQEARDAYLARDFQRAISLYTKAADVPAFRLKALEMLGVTREQTRQFAQAKLAYETALAEYPDDPAARRIRARHQSLVSLDQEPVSLREPTRAPRSVAWHTSASLSQFYRRYSLDIDSHGTTIPIDGLFTDVDLRARRSSSTVSHEARASLGHLQDFTDDAGGDTFRVQTLYWETVAEPLRTGLRVGRQRQRSSGVLGRFDGATAGVRVAPRTTVNALGGYLVDSSFDGPDSERPFWGVNVAIELLDERLELRPFFVQQRFDGMVDREAVGLAGELTGERGNYFAMLDYDLHHEALNHAYVSGNLRLSDALRVYATVDQRRNPYLTTRNALIGQAVQDLSDLEQQLVEERLEDIAADRSAMSTMIRLGMDRSFAAGWALSMDASVADYDATEASANVAALDGHRDVYLTTQLRAENAFGQGNYGAVQLRYFDSDSARSTGLLLNNRLALRERWWLYPRLAVDQRRHLQTDQKELRIKPTLRLDYRHNRHLRLELEAGYEWNSREMPTRDVDTRGTFIRAGYRALF